MGQKLEPILDADGRRLCGICRQLPVGAGNLRKRVYRCQPCHSRLSAPAQLRYSRSSKRHEFDRRYRKTPKGREVHRKGRAKRIFIGVQYHSAAKTAEEAAAINEYIRQRRKAFMEAQRAEETACPFPETVGRNGS